MTSALGLNHPDTGLTLSKLAELNEIQGRPAEAIKYFRRATEIFRNLSTRYSNLNQDLVKTWSLHRKTYVRHVAAIYNVGAANLEDRPGLTAESFEIGQLATATKTGGAGGQDDCQILVILSACNTASGDGKPGAEGLSGLAKSFFYAGSRALLVSHWPVADKAAVRLTTKMLSGLSVNPAIGRAEALRRSMMALLNSPDIKEYAHPMFWAPFVLVGGGG